MNKKQQQGNGKSAEDFLIVNRTAAGYRVYPASQPTQQNVVSGNEGDLSCDCDAFAEDGGCEHVTAVVGQLSDDKRTEHEERRAIQEEGKTARKKRTVSPKSELPAMMTLKRSVSPDGRINSLSMEFSCSVEQVPVNEITSRAAKMLKLQSEIASGFLKSNGKQNDNAGNGREQRTSSNGSVPATMLHIDSVNGRYGARLFIAFQANGQSLKLFGTAKELAQAISGAGYRYGERDIAQGINLDLPCEVVTKPSRDGRYTDIERVLPRNGAKSRDQR